MFTRKMLFAAAIVSAAASVSLAQPKAPDVDEIVTKHVAAMGGAEKIRAIKTSKMTGKMIMGGGQMEAPMVAYTRRPKATRMEFEIQGQKIVQAFDGTTSWAINPMSGSPEPQKAPAEDAKAAADNADPDGSPLIDYKTKGNTVEMLGKEDVEGSMAYKLKVTLKSGMTTTMFLDEKTFLPSKMISKRKQMGQEMEVEAYPSNYKAIDGVQMPFATEIKVGGRSMAQTVVEKVENNIDIDDKIFAFPEKPVAAPKPVAPPK